MKRPLKLTFVVLGLLASGALRMPFEQRLTKELGTAGLLAPPVVSDTREHIGQTSAAVALGGLRTLVASFMNLRALDYFSARNWDALADTYDTIVDLAPRTRQYWEAGSFHLFYDAASYYRNYSDLPVLRNRQLWRNSILRGRAFLERGLRNNPDDWRMRRSYAQELDTPSKLPDYAAAAEQYRIVADSGQAPSFARRFEMHALARSPGREKDALRLARELYADPKNRTPRLMCLLLALEQKADPVAAKVPADERAIRIFGDARKALDALGPYWIQVRYQFPMDGIGEAIAGLEKRLSIAPEDSVFKRERERAVNEDEGWGK